MPLCIAGMHRSGTSMIASLLHECGLDLGPADDLLSANAGNPEGYWESRSFLRLNDAILRALGGSWDQPPPGDAPGWENTPAFAGLRRQAEQLVRRFRGREPWGWKDPRNCLTLPLWCGALPNLKVLICVRNPLAVAESLRARDDTPLAHTLNLWLTYNRRILAAAPRERCLLTHSESYILDPHVELRRVLAWLGMTATEEQIERACARIRPALIHHRMTAEELIEAGASDELVRCYRQMGEFDQSGEAATAPATTVV